MAEKKNAPKPGAATDPVDYSGISQESPNDQKLDRAKLAQNGYTLPADEAEPKTLQELNDEADKEQKAARGPAENK